MPAITKSLLIVSHSRSGHTQKMADEIAIGAQDPEISGVDIIAKDALIATPQDVIGADGLILATPENFGYMSGAMKYFFDGIYYPCLDHTQGTPIALCIRAGNDGLGALGSIRRIIIGLAWKEIAEPIISSGDDAEDALIACRELGMSFAAGLEAGIF